MWAAVIAKMQEFTNQRKELMKLYDPCIFKMWFFFHVCLRLFLRLTVHGMLVVGKELGQSPEGIFLIQVHEQDGSDLTHPLAVAHLLGERRRRNSFS